MSFKLRAQIRITRIPGGGGGGSGSGSGGGSDTARRQNITATRTSKKVAVAAAEAEAVAVTLSATILVCASTQPNGKIIQYARRIARPQKRREDADKIGAIPGLSGKPGIPGLRRAILGLRKFPVCAEHLH